MMTIGFAQERIQSSNTYTIKDLKKEIKLNKDWKAKIGNDPLWKNANLNDENWPQESTLFTKIKDPAYKGEIWFRRAITIDSTLVNIPISLMVTSKEDAKVYLDGNLIGIFGKSEGLTNPETEKNHPIVFAFKNTGKHVLAVHYKTSANTEQPFMISTNGFKLSLITPETYVEKKKLDQYLWLVINGVGTMLITLGVIHFILFGFYRKFISNLFFGIFNLCSGLSMLLGYASSFGLGIDGLVFVNALNQESAIFSLIGGLALSATVNFLFNKRKITFYILAILAFISILLVFLVSKNFILLCSTLCLFILTEAIIVVLIGVINKKQGSKIIGIGLIFSFCLALLLGFFVGFIIGTQKINSVTISILMILAVFSFFSIPFALSAFLASNFASVSKKLKLQLKQINILSEQTLKQEKDRKDLLENKMNFLETEVKERTKEKEAQKEQIEKQQAELMVEKQKSENLLLNILPKDIADELKENGESKVKQFKDVSILFSDFTNLDSVSNQLNSQELLDELNHCFKAFDHITTKHQIEKIKTISYSYMAVSGLPLENENHAKKMIEVAIEMCDFIKNYQNERQAVNKPFFEIKIGINSGEVVAGIVGIKKFAYDIWGDAVNTAARMKGKSENGKINVGHSTYIQTKDFFDFTYRGELEIKGKGLAKMYFVESKTI